MECLLGSDGQRGRRKQRFRGDRAGHRQGKWPPVWTAGKLPDHQEHCDFGLCLHDPFYGVPRNVQPAEFGPLGRVARSVHAGLHLRVADSVKHLSTGYGYKVTSITVAKTATEKNGFPWPTADNVSRTESECKIKQFAKGLNQSVLAI